MLAVVKNPHIEISMHGQKCNVLLDYIKSKFEVQVLSSENEDSFDITQTEFYSEMNENRIGNLLAGARLKKELTQKKLSKIMNISVNKISAFENGKKAIPPNIAIEFSKYLDIKETLLTAHIANS